jgi:hypothetical protein
MRKVQQRIGLLLMLGAATGACVATPPPAPTPSSVLAGTVCRSGGASLDFDFAGAPPSACAVTGAREFTVLVTPEHAPPINPSPWYAFRYQADGTAPVTVTVRYLGGEHRYAPKWRGAEGTWRELPAEPTSDGKGVVIRLPQGQGMIAAQEIITPDHAAADLARWSAATGAEVFQLGTSHDGRAINAIRLGRADAPRLVVLLGRQHPPEVTGGIAMQAFVDVLAERAGGAFRQPLQRQRFGDEPLPQQGRGFRDGGQFAAVGVDRLLRRLRPPVVEQVVDAVVQRRVHRFQEPPGKDVFDRGPVAHVSVPQLVEP